MRYDIYINTSVWKPLGSKDNLIDAIKVIRKNFILRAEFMIIEDDGKSQFPIIFIQNLKDFEELLEKYDLTKPKKYVKI